VASNNRWKKNECSANNPTIFPNDFLLTIRENYNPFWIEVDARVILPKKKKKSSFILVIPLNTGAAERACSI